jgi:hypothetical protein
METPIKTHETSTRKLSVALNPSKREDWDALLSGETTDSAKDAATIDRVGPYFDNGFLVDIKLVQAEPTPYIDLVLHDPDGHQVAVAEPIFELPTEVEFDLDVDGYIVQVE